MVVGWRRGVGAGAQRAGVSGLRADGGGDRDCGEGGEGLDREGREMARKKRETAPEAFVTFAFFRPFRVPDVPHPGEV